MQNTIRAFTWWLVLATSLTASAQGFRNRASSQQIDPIRSGDAVEVRYLNEWHSGTVISFADNKASVEYDYRSRMTTKDFGLADIRFPNGEGQWALWKDSSGKFKVEARYIARDEKSVMIRKEDGTELTIPIEKLSLDLRQMVKRTPITGEENKRDGAVPIRVGDNVQVRTFSDTWNDGVVKRVLIGEAEVEYERIGRADTKKFSFGDIRFPRGEGHWREWSDASGKFKVIARYLSRTETDITILKEDGSELTIPIEKLASKLRRIIAETPVTGKETMIDGVNPIRVGDNVQVRSGSNWYDGVIRESRPGKAVIEYRTSKTGSPYKKEFELKDVRYPNGEGPWQKWRDGSGSFEIVARFIKRDETTVTLLKENGEKITVPIERLDTKLRRTLDEAIVITPKPEKIQFALSAKVTAFMSNAPSFSQLALPGLQTPATPPIGDGGFGFPLTHGDSISSAIPTSGTDPWIAVGTYAGKYYRGNSITRLYWTKPHQRKVVDGPNFQPNQRIVDFSANQSRVITVQVSDGHWEQPEMFCSYRVEAGTKFAKPEAAWDIAEKKKSYGRGSSYLARLVGDNQLLLADGNAVSLYDFGSQRIVYTIDGLYSNHYVLHPSKEYFAVTRKNQKVSLHRTSNGQQIAIDDQGKIGFSQDGRHILRIGPKETAIWDLQQPSAPTILKTRNMSTSGMVTMLNDDWIWANSALYSVNKEMVVWSYSGSGVSIAQSKLIGNYMLVAGTDGSPYSSGRKTALIGTAKVPHQFATTEVERVSANDLIMLKPGSGVRIEATGSGEVRDGVLKAIAANGWVEDPSSEVVIKASAQRGETETITYESSNRFGFGRPSRPKTSTTVSAAPWVQKVEITFRGKTAWTTGRGGIPYSIRIRENESVQAKVNESTQPTHTLFRNLQIPGEMLYPQYRYGLGRTSITTSGFRDKVNDL